MPDNPSQHVPLGKTVPSVAALSQLKAEYQKKLGNYVTTATSSAPPSAVGPAGSEQEQGTEQGTEPGTEQGAAEQQHDAEGAGVGAVNVSVFGAPISSSAAASSGSGKSNSGTAAAGAADSNKLNLRLKEMFKERINSFRESVYLLTGFKVHKELHMDVYTVRVLSKFYF